MYQRKIKNKTLSWNISTVLPVFDLYSLENTAEEDR